MNDQSQSPAQRMMELEAELDALKADRFTGVYKGFPLCEETPELGELAEAMAKFQAECPPIPQSGFNPHFKSKYSTLSDLQVTAYPITGKYGISISQRSNVRATETGAEMVIVTTLRKGTQWERHYACWPVVHDGRGSPSQSVKAALTYAKAGELSCALGVSSGEETDGETDGKTEKQASQGKGGGKRPNGDQRQRQAPGKGKPPSARADKKPPADEQPPPPSDADAPPAGEVPPPGREAPPVQEEVTVVLITPTQTAKLRDLCISKNIGGPEVATVCKEVTGVAPGELTEAQATKLITHLEAK